MDSGDSKGTLEASDPQNNGLFSSLLFSQ